MSSDNYDDPRSEDENAAGEADTLWQRWTNESGLFYQSCAVLGFDPARDSTFDSHEGIEKPPLQFCTGAVRLGLRNVPVFVLLAATLSFVLEQINGFYIPIGTYLPFDLAAPPFSPLALLAFPVVIVWGVVLARIFSGSVSTDNLQIHRTLFFYGTAGVLLVGVAYSVYLVVSDTLTGTRQHLAFRAGYFLFIFLEGHLAYDGLVLRSENLFWNLKDSKIVDQDRYEEFRRQLAENLGAFEFGPFDVWPGDSSRTVGPIHISPGLLFAVVLLAPVMPMPLLAFDAGTTVLGPLPYLVTVVMQLFLVAVLFQFIVLIWQFSKLLSGDYLDYKPFHPDEHGGYRTLGRFATRVNIMLVVAGGYVAFRFFTGGVRQFQAVVDGSTADLLNWGVSFVGPFVVYIAVAILWLYFSFWRMHRQMKRGRREKIHKLQQKARKRTQDGEGSTDHQMEDLELDAPAWESLQGAPVWPIKRRSLIGIAALDSAPILVTMVV